MLRRQLTQGFKCPVRGGNIVELLGILQQRVCAAAIKKRFQPAVRSCTAQIGETTVTLHTVQAKQPRIKSSGRPAEAYRSRITVQTADRSICPGQT
ncbi:hypothetical protein D3C78_1470980 [compost metagenome]